MILNNKEVYDFLLSIGVNHLNHANTVQTACTFLESGGLLSRGAVESKGLKQTWQKSDVEDKKYNVWNDIFLDDVDIHIRRSGENFYGPVLFKYDIKVLLDEDTPQVAVTKSNPQFWNDGEEAESRYFSSIEELEESYSKGTFGQMITLRNSLEPLYFKDYLLEILVDNPDQEFEGINLFDSAYSRIIKAADKSNVSHLVEDRVCFMCECYSSIKGTTIKRMFLD